MDEDTLALLMYLDEGLVKNLSSLMLKGYIDIRTSRIISDKTVIARAGFDNRERFFGEDRFAEDAKEGFKMCNTTKVDQSDVGNSNSTGLEDREFIRREEEIKTIFTSFSLHSQILSNLNLAKAVKTFDNSTLQHGQIKEGEYVRIHGNLTTESINSYLDSMLTVFNCFGCDSLNKMITAKNSGTMNFSAINSMLGHLNNILNLNSTEDMILMCGDTQVVINVNNNFFMNNNAYKFDKVDCPCTVFGKVIKVAPSGQCISLLRKTAQTEYYEKVLDNCCSYCDILDSNGIIMPKKPRVKCEGISLVVIPISICM